MTTQGRYLPIENYPPSYIAPNMLAQPSWKFLLSLVAMKHGVLQREILGGDRSVKVVRARWEAMHLIYRHTQASMPVVGRWLNRHHTSVLYGLSKHQEYGKLVDPLPLPPKRIACVAPPAHDPRQPRTPLQKAVARAYRNHIPPSALAEELGCNAKSVSVLACRMGMRRSDFAQSAEAVAQ